MIGGQWRLPLVGMVVLALAALACGVPSLGALTGGGEGETGGAVDPGAVPGEPVDAGAVPAGDDDVPLTYNGITPGALSSYRSQFVLSFTGTDETGAPADMQYTVAQAYSSDPPASSFTVDAQGAGVPETGGAIQFVQIGETGYMLSEGECLAYSSDSSSPDDMAFTPDDFLMGSDFSQAQRVLPNENVNGVMTRHYRFTENEVSLVASGFTSFQGDIWVAVDGGYVVRQVLSGDGTAAAFDGAQGHMEWTYDLLDINGPVSVTPPEGCDTAPGADLPVMADAYDSTSFGGFVSYSTASPTADVVAFYQAQMPAQGWAPGEVSTDVPGFASLTFTRDAETASVLITEAEGTTSVIVTIE